MGVLAAVNKRFEWDESIRRQKSRKALRRLRWLKVAKKTVITITDLTCLEINVCVVDLSYN